MRLLLRALVAIAVALTTFTPLTASADEAAALATDKEIKALYETFTAAWNRHDTEALGKMWIAEGDHLEPDGRGVRGRESVAYLLKEQHATVFKKTSLKLTIDSVWLVTPDVALADGTYEISGIVGPDGSAIPQRTGHLTSILVRKEGKWGIAGSRLMIPTPLPYKKS